MLQSLCLMLCDITGDESTLVFCLLEGLGDASKPLLDALRHHGDESTLVFCLLEGLGRGIEASA